MKKMLFILSFIPAFFGCQYFTAPEYNVSGNLRISEESYRVDDKEIIIQLFDEQPNEGPPEKTLTFDYSAEETLAYSIKNVVEGNYFLLRAFIDMDGNGTLDKNDFAVNYISPSGGNEFNVKEDISGLDLEFTQDNDNTTIIQDPDSTYNNDIILAAENANQEFSILPTGTYTVNDAPEENFYKIILDAESEIEISVSFINDQRDFDLLMFYDTGYSIPDINFHSWSFEDIETVGGVLEAGTYYIWVDSRFTNEEKPADFSITYIIK